MARAIRLILLTVVMMVVVMAVFPAASFGAVFVSVSIAPPLLPVYSQPICPAEGYIWVPGYWAYGAYGYYWVPGTWVLAPFTGALWTPGYWGWVSGAYVWHEGYWGPQVGFYGGINYGFGYVGLGYAGGYWNNGSFYYNSAVNNVNRTIVHNVYSKPAINNAAMTRVGYNGGSGGTSARPTASELAAARGRHAGPTAAQTQLRQSASTNRAQLASVNHGRPNVLAARTAAAFNGHEAPNKRTPQNQSASLARRTGNPNASSRQTAKSTHAKRQPINHTAARQVSKRAPASRSTAGERAGVSHTAPRMPHSKAAPRPTAPREHAVAQHPATRSNSEPRHPTPPESHYSARNNAAPRPSAPAQRATSPHESTPRPQEQPHPSREGSSTRTR